MRHDKPCGFTLSELLIALVILGLIATFTIPKVLQSQQSSAYKSIGKEAAGIISEAYRAYQSQNSVTDSTRARDLTPYINYVSVRTIGQIDYYQTGTTRDCSLGDPCLNLHNGAVLRATSGMFGDITFNTSAVQFYVDPDGVVTDGGTGDTGASAAGKSVNFWLYANGRIRTRASTEPGTCSASACINAPDPAEDPPWFGWN